MRVLFVLKRFHPQSLFGGAERSAYRLIEELNRSGIDIEVAGARINHDWQKNEILDLAGGRVSVHRLFHPRLRFIGTIVYNMLLLLKILAGKNRYDVIHINFASFEMMTASAARMLGGPPVLCKVACSGSSGEIDKVRGNRYFGIFRYLLTRVDMVASLSSEISGELEDVGVDPERIAAVVNGVDVERFKPPSPAERAESRRDLGIGRDEFAVLFTGRLSRQKGLDILIEAIALISIKDAVLIIAGKGSERKALESLAAKLGVTDRVRFLGPLPDTVRLYHAADVFVLPSRDEGLSNSLLEAMSVGLRVVATRVSGSSEAVEDGVTGFLVEPGEPLPLAGATEKAALDRDHMGSEARRRALERYSICGAAGRYIGIYRKLAPA